MSNFSKNRFASAIGKSEARDSVRSLRKSLGNLECRCRAGIEEAKGVAAPPALHATRASVRYVLGTDVPYNWFPLIPVHVPGSSRSIQLQRARMPGADRARRTAILSPPTPYYIDEDEVPRDGKIVTVTCKRSRWLNGATITWIGRRVTAGRGEGSSGLALDQIVDIPSSNA